MGQSLTIQKRNGQKRYLLDSYTQLCTVKSAEQKCALLGEDTVTLKLTSAKPLQFVVGDYMEVFGSVYTLNKFDEPTKNGEGDFEYSLIFEGLQYKLLAAQYRSADAQGLNPTAEFPLVCDMRMAMGVLINNINRVAAPDNEVWELGDCIDTEFKEYSFSKENCLEVLQRLCQDNKCEFEIQALGNRHYKLHIRQKVGSLFPAKFTFGRGGGIYQLKRRNVNNDDVISRLYVEGGTQNITSKYRNGAQRLRLAVNAESYIEDELAIKAFGVKEGSRTYDDIYPTRTGYVTSIVEGDVLSFIDEEMFDLNEKDENGTKYLIDGTSAKVKFTGNHNLAGYTFDIHSYDHKTHKFTLVRYEDSRGFKYPSDTAQAYQIEKGAEYVLLDIVMPQDPYEVDAEAKLLERAQADLAADCQPKVSYELDIEGMTLERAYGSEVGITNVFQLGDLLHIVDADINVDKAIRLTGFTRDCYSQPYKYKLTLSDTIEVSLIQSILEDIDNNEQDIIDLTNKTNVELMRMQWRTTQELLGMVFDADGYFDTSHIRPSSIETLMLSVGNRNGQFIMRDVIITCNALVGGKPNPNYFTVQSHRGILQHYAIEEQIRTWAVSSNNGITLQSNGAMFLYAQCQKAGSTCQLILSQNRMATEVGTYYYFLVGVLSSVYNGYRELTTTYGNTRITGRCINCGRIESADKQTYFDLDNSEIGGNIKFRSSTGDLLNVSELEQQLNDSTDNLNQTLQEIQNTIAELQDQVDGAIEYWFGEGVPAIDTEPASQWTDDATKQTHLGDIYTDTQSGLEYRFTRRGRSAIVNGQVVRIWEYYWQNIPSTGIGTAIQAANNALDLAGSKAHVYVTANASTPPPATYHKGDLWITLNNYKIKLCIANAGSAYKSTDWKDAGYTDDTQANKALQQLTDMASDSIITPAEKVALKDEMENIKVDYSTVRAKATLVGCSTTDFDAAYSALLAYVNGILANMSANSTVTKSQYTNNFTAYYTERTNLLQAISSKYTDTAIGDMNIGGTNYIKNSAFMENTNGWAISLSATNKSSSLTKYADTTMGNVLRIQTANVTPATGISMFNWFYFGTGMQSAGGNITLPDNKFRNGVTYTVAFWVKASTTKTLQVGFMDGTTQNVVAPLKSFGVSTKWQRVSYTFAASNLSNSGTRLYIRASEENLPTNLYFTKFVLVEGNKAPEWQPNNAEQMAAVQANTDLLKAIRDNYTQIEGGLILSTFLKLGALQSNGQWQESAGLKAMLANKDEIAAYFGGTYAEALAGTKAGMTVIYHNGKLKALNAEITGIIHALGGEFDGYIRTIFKEIEDSDATQISSGGYNRGSWRLNKDLNIMCSHCGIQLPNSKDYIGSRVLIYNNCYLYTRSGDWTTTVTVQGGGRIYGTIESSGQDASASFPTSVCFASTMLEFVGIVDPENANACTWAVLNYNPNMDYYGSAKIPNCMIFGRVLGRSNGASLDYSGFNTNQIASVSRVSQGRYKLTFRNAFASSLRYQVMLQGEGWVYGADTAKSTAYVKATLLSKQAGYFEVGISDDESSNDGTFCFMVFAL